MGTYVNTESWMWRKTCAIRIHAETSVALLYPLSCNDNYKKVTLIIILKNMAKMNRKYARGFTMKKEHWAIVIIVLIGILVLAYVFYPSSDHVHPSLNGAAIVDQLSVSQPNETFVQEATDVLERAGLGVDYYPAEKVTVEFYRHLPEKGYKLIIMRVHSSTGELIDDPESLALFTYEKYSEKKYVIEQLSGKISPVQVFSGDEQLYFGIREGFVSSSMKGEFNNTTIIFMGCSALSATRMSQSFVERGARVCIGCNGLISAPYIDEVVIQLLHHLLIDNQTFGDAVNHTLEDMGTDPQYGSEPLFYPEEAADETFWAPAQVP
ncbi:MAG: hypothetical protein DRN07_07270 [Thermoplasmata archaeon]|nr:MAG: hypothetical protein DRN07_07270 [Thermoplasmata archaeon]